MVRTAETAKISSGGTKKTTAGSSKSISQSSSSSDKGGGNPVCPRETPSWQKPITNFFTKADKEKPPRITKDGRKETPQSDDGQAQIVTNEAQSDVEITSGTSEEPGCSSAKPNINTDNNIDLQEKENTANSKGEEEEKFVTTASIKDSDDNHMEEKENVNTTNDAETEEKNDDDESDTVKKRKINYESFEKYENASNDSTQLAKRHKI